jgi:hypothetical protein
MDRRKFWMMAAGFPAVLVGTAMAAPTFLSGGSARPAAACCEPDCCPPGCCTDGSAAGSCKCDGDCCPPGCCDTNCCSSETK